MRKGIDQNTQRKLWAVSGGFCQNPACGKYLLHGADDEVVNLGIMAHMIAHSSNGPRGLSGLNEEQLNDYTNLLMLCMDCHKIVDTKPEQYPVHLLERWKKDSESLTRSNKVLPSFGDKTECLLYILSLLEENNSLFNANGPSSENALNGRGGDSQKIWDKRCIDTIVPNNRLIIDAIQKHIKVLGVEYYRKLFEFKAHALPFEENKIFNQSINDYPLFPENFSNFIKSELGIIDNFTDKDSFSSERPVNDRKSFDWLLDKPLAGHRFITISDRKYPTFVANLSDERKFKVHVSTTYYISAYTVLAILDSDPDVQVIISASPYANYSDEAKKICIEKNIGLFKVGAFMGAVTKKEYNFVNYLFSKDRSNRIHNMKAYLQKGRLSNNLKVFVHGSFLRQEYYTDVDLFVVYKGDIPSREDIGQIYTALGYLRKKLDIIVCNENEYEKKKLLSDNCERVF